MINTESSSVNDGDLVESDLGQKLGGRGYNEETLTRRKGERVATQQQTRPMHRHVSTHHLLS